ncbi:MAG: peptide-methionine (S)-S-oxide reductase MsrA [Spirochaetales bacterium]|nr:peptide-methionine (S)-S-oxide reductase MsrA [Spirochaetales bacterium]
MTEQAVFGGGCFWCLEAVFQQIPGVVRVESGYAGGKKDAPTYEEVCTGNTGHAEVVRLEFDPDRVSYAGLLEIFWKCHDPTSLNRQGADVGTQYRSAIFYYNAEQERTAEFSRQTAQRLFSSPIVTQITALTRFWPAEPYHQNYYRQHPSNGYCQAVISPKLKKIGLVIQESPQ